MEPTGNNHSFVLPLALLAEVEAAADEEHRPVDDVVRDFVERGLRERRNAVTASAPAVLKRTPAEAAARILAHRPLRRLPEGETIRSMIEHGRA